MYTLEGESLRKAFCSRERFWSIDQAEMTGKAEAAAAFLAKGERSGGTLVRGVSLQERFYLSGQ